MNINNNHINNNGAGHKPLLEVLLTSFLSGPQKPLEIPKETLDISSLNGLIENYLKQVLYCGFSETQGRENFESTGTQSVDPAEPAEYVSESRSDTGSILPGGSSAINAESDNEVLESLTDDTEKIIPPASENQPVEPQPMMKMLGVPPEVMDTHQEFIIRLKVPDGIGEDPCDIGVNELRAAIRWKSSYTEQLIPLPGNIDASGASASIKDKILEIKIPKNHRGAEKEISIRRQ